MITKRCSVCVGSGKMMSGGMIFKTCEFCDGIGTIKSIDYEDVKNTKSYTEAIKKIKSNDENISDEKADEIFKTEYQKIETTERKRGRPKNGTPRG